MSTPTVNAPPKRPFNDPATASRAAHRAVASRRAKHVIAYLGRGPLAAADRQLIRETLANVPDLDEVLAAEATK